MKRTNLFLFTCIAMLIALLSGCGGGGGGGGSSTGGGSTSGGSTSGATGRLNAFITDDISSYSQVWVAIYKLELFRASGEKVTVVDYTTPVTVNLAALRDGTGARFKLLNSLNIPTDTYTLMNFTVQKDLTVLEGGSFTLEPRQFDDALDAGAGKSTISVSLGSGTTLGNNSPLIIDFDLKNWGDNGTKIVPVVNKIDDSTVSNLTRHEQEDYKGTVSNLTATSFTLGMVGGGSFTVTYTASTPIFDDNGVAGPQLANGAIVEIRGAYSTSSNSLVATSIKLEDTIGPELKVKGVPVDYNESNGDITIEITEARGFVPSSTTLVIGVADATKFLSDAGSTITRDDFVQLMFLGSIEAESNSAALVGKFVARKLKLEDIDDDDGGGQAEGKGLVSDVDISTGTFRLKLSEWFGFTATSGSLVQVATGANTIYEDADGNELSDTEFFDLLGATTVVDVKGSYNGTTLTASRARIKD